MKESCLHAESYRINIPCNRLWVESLGNSKEKLFKVIDIIFSSADFVLCALFVKYHYTLKYFAKAIYSCWSCNYFEKLNYKRGTSMCHV